MHRVCITIGRWMLIAAMMTAFGGHWIVLQSVAWTTMIIDNAKSEHLGEALTDTFDGKHPCPLCKSIEKGRESEKKQDIQVVVSKMNLFLHASSVALFQPLHFWQQKSHDVFAGDRPLQPLLQPPRVSQVS